MASPISFSDTELSESEQVSESEQASCSTITDTPIASFASGAAVALNESSSSSSAEDEEAMLGSGYLSMPVSIETEFEELDANNSWTEAHLEVSDQCYDYYCRVGRAWENRSRNRYVDVTPYDHSRVRLKVATIAPGGGFNPGLGLVLPGDSCESSVSSSVREGGEGGGEGGEVYNDYINASFVVMEAAQRKYILTQGPLPNTSGHFWLMVWQQNSRGVIMLNQWMEKSPMKRYKYWPSRPGQTLLFEETGITVHMMREEMRPYHTIRYLRLQNMMTGEAKAIFHFHFTSWPDLGVPESPTPFLAFLFMIRESGFLNYEQEPAVIHCRAGIGSSGTFALIDSCLVLMEKKDDPFTLNIKRVLVVMRKYRMGLVETPGQLRFSYMAIIEGAKYLMGDESVRKKWKDSNSAEQAPRYFYGDLPPQRYRRFRLILEKDEEESQIDLLTLTSEMSNRSSESIENSRKRLFREAVKSNKEEETLKNIENPCKIICKRKWQKPNK